MKWLGVFCLLVIVNAGTSASDDTEWHFITTNNNGDRLRASVGLNRRNMILIPDPVTRPERCVKRTVNQHDFENRLVAMKDPVKRECWVKPLGKRETYEDVKRIIDSGNDMIQHSEDWIVSKRALDKDQVEREVGSLLADFCSDADVYMLKRANAVLDKKKVKNLCVGLCGRCKVIPMKQL
ncbi:uncharacterized protein LOC121386366 [Gigantopelta aegis]|uniref:uncharacterized protein LOC121386366 n=1 Tax=Gigantopelta aegis TaxID=1735272 RepID=UPI001B88A97A|nr:uncharacterized protein LOC121386366 [Gigantopelta aegis]XP_041373184.1 uncharacterized protein LOC121386366 [Gigantopelta aegis]